MPVRVARGTKARIREYADHFVIQVQRAVDAQVAREALESARAEISALDGSMREKAAYGLQPEDPLGPKYVSQVLPAATGPFLIVDGSGVPHRLLDSVPEIVVRELERAGVREAVVAAPQPGGMLGFQEDYPRAVVLWLLKPPPIGRQADGELPGAWLAEAVTWVRGELDPEREIWAAVQSIDFPLPIKEAESLLEHCREARPRSARLAAGRPPAPPRRRRMSYDEGVLDRLRRIGGRIRAANASFTYPRLALAAGGPEASDEELFAAFEALKEIARRLAPELAYAYVSLSPSFRAFTDIETWAALDPLPLCDVLIFDAFPYQVLGPGHLERLGGAPEGSRELAGGRVELELGRPRDWIPQLEQAAREELAPCLLGYAEAGKVKEARFGERRYPSRSDGDPARRPKPAFLSEGQERAVPTELVSGDRYLLWSDRFYSLSPSLLLGLHQPPAQRPGERTVLEGELFEAAADWVAGQGDGELWAVYGGPFRISPADSQELLEYAYDQWASGHGRGGPALLALEPSGRIRYVLIDTGPLEPSLHLIGGVPAGRQQLAGPSSYEPVLSLVESLKGVARRVAPHVAYAYITLDPGHPLDALSRWTWRGFGEPPILVRPICDEYVFDAFHYQVLSPGHVHRLGALPDGAERLPSGRVELTIGRPEDWLPLVRAAGRKALAPCLLTGEEARKLVSARRVAWELGRRGASEATTALACTGGPLDALPEVERAVILRLYPRSRKPRQRPRIPQSCIDSTLTWLSGEEARSEPLQVAVEGCMQLALPSMKAPLLFEASLPTPETLVAIRGELDERIRGANHCFPNIALAFGGPATGDDELLAAFERLKRICRALAGDLYYGCLSFEATFEGFARSQRFGRRDWRYPAWESSCLDAFPYQVLGRKHLERLGETPPGAVPLSEGQVELSIGEPADWLLPGAGLAKGRLVLLEEGRGVLAPCLATEE